MLLWTCLIARILSNPFSNVFQKYLTGAGVHPLVVIWAVHGLLSLACLPWIALRLPSIAVEFVALMAVSSLLTVSGNLLIVEAVRLSDLSVLGPINSYKAVVSLVPGMVLLGEFPGPLGIVGIVLIVAGSWFLVRGDGERRYRAWAAFLRDRGIQFRLAALVISALEAVVMRKAMEFASAETTLAYWALLGFVTATAVLPLIAGSGRMREQIGLLKGRFETCLLLVLTTGIMQGCTIVVFERMQVSYALALFQTSTIVSVILGWRYFQEPHIVRRLVGSLFMVAGAVLIVLAG